MVSPSIDMRYEARNTKHETQTMTTMNRATWYTIESLIFGNCSMSIELHFPRCWWYPHRCRFQFWFGHSSVFDSIIQMRIPIYTCSIAAFFSCNRFNFEFSHKKRVQHSIVSFFWLKRADFSVHFFVFVFIVWKQINFPFHSFWLISENKTCYPLCSPQLL